MIVSSADRNKKLQKIFLNCAHFIVQIMPESQRSRKQHQKVTDIEKHIMYPLTFKQYSSFDNGSSSPIPYKPPAQENLKLSLEEQSHSVICGLQTRRRKWKTKHPDKLQR